MANNRMWLVNRVTDEKLLIAKLGLGWFIWPKRLKKKLTEFFKRDNYDPSPAYQIEYDVGAAPADKKDWPFETMRLKEEKEKLNNRLFDLEREMKALRAEKALLVKTLAEQDAELRAIKCQEQAPDF